MNCCAETARGGTIRLQHERAMRDRKPVRAAAAGEHCHATSSNTPRRVDARPAAARPAAARLRPLGEDVTEILDYVPGTFRVIRHVRPKLSCRTCETIVQAPAPKPADPAWPRRCRDCWRMSLVAKYCDHQPLHRQAEQLRARGRRPQPLDAGRHGWADRARCCARWSMRLARHVLSGARLHADDTTVPVLAPGLGRTKTGRLWTYVRDDRPVRRHRRRRRCSTVTRPIARASIRARTCAGFRGILQADGYAGFARLYGNNRIVEAACMAHARRKFFDVFETTKSPLARDRAGQDRRALSDRGGRSAAVRRMQRLRVRTGAELRRCWQT